jgi:di/tricarboxylate transporter
MDVWLTAAVIATVVVLLALGRVRPAVVVLGGTLTLLVTGVIEAEQALAGFSNPAPVTVAALYVVAGAVERTGALEAITDRLLGSSSSDGQRPRRRELARILLPVAGASAFLNNTPIVAMVAPRLLAWTRRTGRAPSHYLMPLSFATILGGVIATIGTSTNLVVNGLMTESGVRPIGLFELSKAGLPIAAAGLVVLLVAGRLLLVDRRSSSDAAAGSARQFTVEMRVRAGSQLVGRSVGDSGLRNLQGVYLAELERDGERLTPVAPDQRMGDGDRLVFVGDVRRILDLQKMSGLEAAECRHFDVTGGTRRFYEVVVAAGGDLAGGTLKSTGFRSRYGAAVVAIHRAAARVDAKLGEVVLRPGDVLLVLADQAFAKRNRSSPDFLLIAEVSRELPLRREGARVTQLAVLALIALAGTGLVDILTASLLAVAVLLATRVISVADAKDSLQLGVLVLIAASFGLGAAMTETGLGERLAEVLSAPLAHWGPAGLLAGIIVTTTVLTALVNNNASAVLMWPIAMSTARCPTILIPGRSPSRSWLLPQWTSSRQWDTRPTRWSTGWAGTGSRISRGSDCRSPSRRSSLR